MKFLEKLTVKHVYCIIGIIVYISVVLLYNIHIEADYSLLIDFSRTLEWVWFFIKHTSLSIVMIYLIVLARGMKKDG